mmetsp:Transcript_12905/g.24100  ORF Transcript_12905/g.24100 Transcript_12905/m.24100 type:complete len:105 (-) Transcript_12905:115-429(-)
MEERGKKTVEKALGGSSVRKGVMRHGELAGKLTFRASRACAKSCRKKKSARPRWRRRNGKPSILNRAKELNARRQDSDKNTEEERPGAMKNEGHDCDAAQCHAL